MTAVKAGIVKADGTAKYTGMHCLRHYYASWCINRPQDGGLGLSPKSVQERVGHAKLAMTMDTYGHLFPAVDTGEMDVAVDCLMGVTKA